MRVACRGRVPFAVRLAVIISIVSAVWVSGYGQASSAAPRVMMFYGDLLESPVFIAGQDSFDLMVELAKNEPSSSNAVSSDVTYGRPRIDIAFFWGPQWKTDEASLARLTPEQTSFGAMFFPAAQGAPAIIHYRGYYIASEPTLEILRKFGVPTSVDVAFAGSRSTGSVVQAAVLAAFAFAFVVFARRSTRDSDGGLWRAASGRSRMRSLLSPFER